MTDTNASVQGLVARARALADEVQRYVATESDDRGFGAAAVRMAEAVAVAPDAEWAAYEALNMGSSVSGGLSHAFDGGDRRTSEASRALQEVAWRIARAYPNDHAGLDEELDAWQRQNDITPTPRDGRPPIEG